MAQHIGPARTPRERERDYYIEQQEKRLREAQVLIDDIYDTHRDRNDPDSDWVHWYPKGRRDGVWADEKCAWCIAVEAWREKVKELL